MIVRMLIPRDAQTGCFETEALLRYEQNLEQHFLRTYPRECRQAGDENHISLLVRDGIERAGKVGFTTSSEIALFIGLGFILDRDFYRDPQIPCAAELLNSGEIRNPSLRINAAYDERRVASG
jgi:hypothetical protein